MADLQRKTANLCPPINSAYGWVTGYRNGNSGDYVSNNTNYEWLSPFFELSAFGTSFTISADKSTAKDSMSVYYYNGDSFIGSQSSSNYNGMVFDNIPNGTTKFCFAIRAYAKTESEQIASGWRVWVNAGSTALPYEPYGWVHSLRKLTTATDTFTTLPVDIYADGNNATVSISGNTVQNGTPTPDNPIMAQGTGERTGNLWDGIIGVDNVILDQNGTPTPNNAYALSKYIPVEPNTSYIYHFYHNIAEGNRSTYSVVEYDSNKNVIRPLTLQRITENRDYNISFTTQANSAYIRINWKKAPDEDLMLNTGSTPLPYEPYGYKIPILSAEQTTPVYLGEVESTRLIKKLVLTGEENWSVKQTGEYKNFSLSLGANGIRVQEEKSTHFQCIRITESGNTDVGFCIIASGLELRIRPENVSTTSLDDFKTYLQQQYANGTPVTVWHVLANPETAVVNEPLMKIGDYADTVSGITVPTRTGKDTFDVETSLKPSESSLSYTGWHNATVEEWDGSQWNE